MKLVEKWAKRLKQQDLEHRATTKMWHSRSYHNHFMGYSEQYQIDEKGKHKIVRTYTGNYYEANHTVRQKLLSRILYLLLFGVSISLFLFCTTRPTIENTLWYVTIFQFASVPLYGWLTMSLRSYLCHFSKFKEGEYRTGVKHLLKSSLYLSIALFLAGTAMFIAALCAFSSAIYGLLVITAAIMVFAINRLEQTVEYTIISE